MKMKDLPSMVITLSIFTVIIFVIMMLFKSCDSYIDNFNNDDKKKSFNIGNTFRCSEHIFDSKRILVRKSDGWRIHKDTFKKDGLLLPIYKCKEETEY